MDISKQMHNDHSDLRSLGQDILKASDGGDVGGRDNQFDLYDVQLRRHLAVVEEVLLAPLKKSDGATQSVDDVKAQHKAIRKDLKHLDRKDKGSHEWTAEFRALTDKFEAMCKRHEALAHQCESAVPGGSDQLARDYEEAKLNHMRGGYFSWNKVGAAVGAAAAVAGAAYAANRYFKSGRRSSGRAQDDFELRLETDETLRLIASDKVEGTAVVDRDGARIGTIKSFMVDKYSGRVAYAVMSFGGTMGFGASLFPLPWPVLDYDEQAGGYMLDISKEEMASAPRFEASDTPEFTPEYRRSILLFYRPVSIASTGSQDKSAIGGEQWSGSKGQSGTETSRQSATPQPTPTPAS